MQYILNSKERNLAFMKFLLPFVVTVSIIVGSLYFNFKIPSQLNKTLKTEIENKDNDLKQQEHFVKMMNETKLLIDSLSKNGSDIRRIGMQVDNKLKELSTLPSSPNSVYENMNSVIITNFLQLQSLEKHEKELTEKLNKLNVAEEKLNQCELKLYGSMRLPSNQNNTDR